MALRLGIEFSGIVFPVAVAMRDFVELVARLIEHEEGFGPAFDGARFAPARAIGDLIAGDGFQQSSQEFLLLFPGTRLGDGDTELTSRIDRSFETQSLQRHVMKGPRLGH